MVKAAIVDVDGTLADTNYHHAIAWDRAFSKHGFEIPLWRIHRHMGMGGDHLVESLAGEQAETDKGEDIRDAEGELYSELIGEVRTLPGARELISDLRERDLVVVLASSAKSDEVNHYLDLLDARELVSDWTTSDDVEATKPEPDLIEAALEKAGTRDAILVGDSTWDIEAAKRAGIQSLGVLTGGFGSDELRDAGCAEVYESVAQLRERLAETPFGAG